MTILGLFLIGLGSGGIKPCVAAFGGEQFKMPEQARQLATFFSLFYFSINAGSLISTSVTPVLREDVSCFGMDDCFPLAFGVPAVLMVVAILFFVFGKFLYKILPNQGNMLVKVTRCIVVSIYDDFTDFHFKDSKIFRMQLKQKKLRKKQTHEIIGLNMLKLNMVEKSSLNQEFFSIFWSFTFHFHFFGHYSISRDRDGLSKQQEWMVMWDFMLSNQIKCKLSIHY